MIHRSVIVRGLFAVVAACMAILFAIGATEIVLRLVDYPKLPTTGWKHAPELQDTNQLGYRGRPIVYSPENFIVLLVGDSQVECVSCPPEETPEIILETELQKFLPGIRVFGLGARGYGQDQEYLAMQEYYKHFRADLVVLWQTLGNDIWNNTFPTHGTETVDGTPKPTFRLKNNRLIAPSQLIGDPVYRMRIEALLILGLWGGLDSFWELYLPKPYTPKDVLPPNAENGDLLTTTENLKTEKSHWSIWLTPTSPRTQYGMDLTRHLLSQMENLARAHHAAFLIFQEDRNTATARRACEKFPFYRKGRSVINYNGRFYEADSEQYYATRDYVNRGFLFISIPITEPDHTVGENDCHLNVRGNRQVLRDLSQAMMKSNQIEIQGGSRARIDD